MDLAKSVRIAVLCYERQHLDCHRSTILDVASQQHGVRVLEL